MTDEVRIPEVGGSVGVTVDGVPVVMRTAEIGPRAKLVMFYAHGDYECEIYVPKEAKIMRKEIIRCRKSIFDIEYCFLFNSWKITRKEWQRVWEFMKELKK